MNPSSSGWINKYVFILKQYKNDFIAVDEQVFYDILRENGFIYGYSTSPINIHITSEYNFTDNELAKVNLLHSLFYYYFQYYPESDYNDCVAGILDFYHQILPEKSALFPSLTGKKSIYRQLEAVLSARILKGQSLDKFRFEKLMTNALLFVDVIAFKKFLEGQENLPSYMDLVEYNTIHSCFLALQSKENKSSDDMQLLELFYQSDNLLSDQHTAYSQDSQLLLSRVEKWYLLDLVTLAIRNDLHIDPTEEQFLTAFAQQLNLGESDAETAMGSIKKFVEKHQFNIQLFKYKYPVKEFYSQSSKTVTLLILRNKKRLIKEIIQSKDLVILLGKSTYSDLNTEEKKKVKTQLLDICKAVPSLTIFLLPGGSLLLPLLVKFIPELLPSAFQDNKIPK